MVPELLDDSTILLADGGRIRIWQARHLEANADGSFTLYKERDSYICATRCTRAGKSMNGDVFTRKGEAPFCFDDSPIRLRSRAGHLNLPIPASSIIVDPDRLYICSESPPKLGPRNIRAYDRHGEPFWTVAAVPLVRIANTYFLIAPHEKDPTLLLAALSTGQMVDVDRASGKIVGAREESSMAHWHSLTIPDH